MSNAIDNDEEDDGFIIKRAILIQKPGFYRMASAQYFAEPCPTAALTSSGIKLLCKKPPAAFAYTNLALNPDSEEPATTAAKRIGDVGHQLALGNGRGYAVGDFKTWGSNAAKAFKREAIDAGLTPVKVAEFGKCERMADVMSGRIKRTLAAIAKSRNIEVPEGGVPYQTEVVAAWIEETPHGPVWCRMMMDVWCESLLVILDPKFTDRIADGVVEAHIANMGWDLQGAWYPRGIEALIPDAAGRVTFANLMIETQKPHLSRSVQMNEGWRYSSQLECERALSIFARCMANDAWPAYPEAVEILAPKPWTLKERLDRELEESEEEDQ